MSSMAVASGVRSTLNPNAPLFIPAAIQQVEDFSPEWWELVKTTTWFRDHWFRQHQEQDSFDCDDDEDVVNLLPDSVDLDIAEELSSLEAELNGAYYETILAEEMFYFPVQEDEKPGLAMDAANVIKGLSLKLPRNGSVKHMVAPAKYREKPVQCVSPKPSPRRIIQQPR